MKIRDKVYYLGNYDVIYQDTISEIHETKYSKEYVLEGYTDRRFRSTEVFKSETDLIDAYLIFRVREINNFLERHPYYEGSVTTKEDMQNLEMVFSVPMELLR